MIGFTQEFFGLKRSQDKKKRNIVAKEGAAGLTPGEQGVFSIALSFTRRPTSPCGGRIRVLSVQIGARARRGCEGVVARCVSQAATARKNRLWRHNKHMSLW